MFFEHLEHLEFESQCSANAGGTSTDAAAAVASATPKEEGASSKAVEESGAAAAVGKDGEDTSATNRVGVLLTAFSDLLEDSECEVSRRDR